MDEVKHVSPEEYEALVRRLENRRLLVAKAQRALDAAKTLEERIIAIRLLNAAREVQV